MVSGSRWFQVVSTDFRSFFVLVSTPSFCSVFWYVRFYKNLIVLHHGDIIFCFGICIKFSLSTKIRWICHWSADFQKQLLTDVFQNRCSLKISQDWSLSFIKMQAFFYRTLTVGASRFSRQQTLFSGWICYLLLTVAPLLFRTPIKTRGKPQKQPLELFCKKVFLEVLQISQENTSVEVSF